MLTKSDFLDFRHCAKSFWLKSHRRDAVDWPAPSAFDRKIMADGYAVEREAHRYIATRSDAGLYQPQRIFQTDDLFARADLVKTLEDGAIELFEIKSSTSIKVTADQDHITDVAFQVLAARRTGVAVRGAHLVHVNGDYVRKGDVDAPSLLIFANVTAEVEARLTALEGEIAEALALLALDAIDENGCSCVYFGSPNNRCAAFAHFNPVIPEPSIYLLPRISAKKVALFHGEGRLALSDIAASELTPTQLPVHASALQGKPVINVAGIRSFLDQLVWPLHFYDYESFAAAVPRSDGHRPHEQMPVQYSLHILHENGNLEHCEFLTTEHGEQRALIEHMQARIQPVGTMISWYKTFECGCNTRMALLHPEKSAFLLDLNDRTVDLMDPFKTDYVDIGFKGSTSIKKVLPVLCPTLQYDEHAVHDGGGAMEAWLRMVETDDPQEKARLASELIAYCTLDTLAMVEIYRALKQVI